MLQRRSQGGGVRWATAPPIGDPSNFLIYEIDSFLLTTAPLVCLFNWQSDIQTRFHLRKTIIHDIIRDEIE